LARLRSRGGGKGEGTLVKGRTAEGLSGTKYKWAKILTNGKICGEESEKGGRFSVMAGALIETEIALRGERQRAKKGGKKGVAVEGDPGFRLVG